MSGLPSSGFRRKTGFLVLYGMSVGQEEGMQTGAKNAEKDFEQLTR